MSCKRVFKLSVYGWLLATIFLAALAIRLRGIDWPNYHPDEYPIAAWIQDGMPGRVYPGGFFVMIRPVRGLWIASQRALHGISTFLGIADSPPSSADYILMGRVFNAVLGALTCVIIYLASVKITASKKAALVSAAFFSFAQYHVEHCHYAESDIAMLFMLSVALWCWAVCIRTRRTSWFVATALTCGFAVGTKFTLSFLFVPLLVFSAAHGWGLYAPGRWARATKFLAAGFVLFLIGLVVATPDIVGNTSKFMDGLAYERMRVYQEGVFNMGISAGDSILRLGSRWRDLRVWSGSLGQGWRLLWLVAFPCVFLRPFRRFWVPLVLIPVVFTVYWFFLSPWVRTQEFMVYFPFAALLAPFPLLVLWRAPHRSLRALAIVLLAVSLGENTVRGLRVSSVFGWTDTRLLAGRWMQRHEPDGMTFAYEKYAQTPSYGRSIGIDMIARSGIDAVRDEGMDFVMRNGAEGRRGMLHPVTRKRYPNYEERYQEFLSGSERLLNWSLLPPRATWTSFNSTHLDLYGLRRFAQEPSFNGHLPQPVLLSSEARETFFPVGRHLGSATAVRVDRHGVTCAVGGPAELRGPVYAILYTRQRSANIRLRGFGRHVRVRLGPYDAHVVPLQRPWWAPRLGHVERIHARAAPVRHITDIPAFLRIAFSEDEVGRILDDLGVDHTFPAHDSLPLEELARLRESPNTDVAYRGVSAWYYDRFSRLRIPEFAPNTFRFTLGIPEKDSPSPDRFEGLLEFPVERPANGYTLRFDFRAYWHRFSEDEVKAIEFFDVSTGAHVGTVEPARPHSSPPASVALAVTPGEPGPIRLLIRAPEAVTVRIENVMLEWDIRAALDAEIRRAALARTEHMLTADRYEEALSAWRRIPPARVVSQDISRRRLRLEILLAMQDARPSDLAEAAADLLVVAPNHFAALTVLAEHKKDAAERMRRLAVREEHFATFGQFIRVLDFSWDAQRRWASCTVEVMRDNPPPFVLCVLRRRHGRWRTREKYPFVDPRPLAAGERFVLEFPVPEHRKYSSRTNALALAVESNTRYVPGRLPVSSSANGVLRFSDLIGSPP